MPYAMPGRANYAAGDYYRYQAGGLFGFLGKAVGAVTGVVGKVLPGPLGAAASAVSKMVTPKGKSTDLVPYTGGMIPMMAAPNVPRSAPGAIPVPGITGAVERFLPGGQTGYSQTGGPGWHLNKQDGKYGAAGTYWVRNRAMNPGNARALRRAIRREKAFVSLAKRVLRGTGISVSRRSFSRKPARRR
jgi:hypothetical protein